MSSSPEDLLQQFRERVAELKADYIPCTDIDDASRKLKALLASEDWDQVVLGGELSSWVEDSLVGIAEPIAGGSNETSGEEWLAMAAGAKAGITGVEALISDTGTLVIPSRRRGDRLASLLPPNHIALIFGAIIYETLADFLQVAENELTYQLISGPSRTADIEKELVIGVHGPVRLIILGPD